MRSTTAGIRAASSFLVLAGAALCACENDSTGPRTGPFASLGELQDAIADALASPDPADRSDRDGDGLPDRIEDRLATSATDRDTDHDGLVDNIELFGTGTFDRAAPLPDADGDGAIAPVDDDDDADGSNDGARIDSDGDGVANYLEYYGYRYDWLTGAFLAWNGDPEVPHVRTDPLQFSTDQDAYSDAMEVSGIGLDVTVRAPGNHPLVPAVPNIVVELVGYSVTLSQSITYGEGASLQVGQTWERTTEQSHSYTDERSWEAGIEAGYTGGGGHVVVHANYGESYASTQSMSTSIATGTSILDSSEWSVARTVTPTDVAHVKLYVKVHNRGGAPLSAIVPTLTLQIGGLDIATFQPAATRANILVPGDTYPADPNVTWVIDAIDTGGGSAPLSLTMRELRALENGAPISIVATQLVGDVMRLDEASTWQSVGDVNEYLARCEAISANIRIDLGDGTLVQQLVYAGDGPSSVAVSVRDALALLGVDDDGALALRDPAGAPRTVSLASFAFVFDRETLRRNGWTLGDGETPSQPPPGFELAAMRLYPGSSLLVRAPREQTADEGPVIHFAYIDLARGEVNACATDYQGIARVVVTTPEGERSLALHEDIPGAGYFTAVAAPDTFAADQEYVVQVTNRSGQTASRSLGTLFVQPGPRLPLIHTVTLDLASHRIYAHVESGAPADSHSEIAWVRVYHPGLDGGYVTMDHVPNEFEDPDGYVADIPAAFQNTNVEVVAYVAANVYARHAVTPAEVVRARVAGTIWLPGHIDTTGTDEEWSVPRLDLDTGAYARYDYEADNWSDSWNPAPPTDLWVVVDEGATGWVYFNARYVRVPGGYDYATLTQEQIIGFVPNQTAALPLGSAAGLEEGTVLAFETTEHRYAKARVVQIATSDNGWTNAYDRTLVLEYVTYEPLPP